MRIKFLGCCICLAAVCLAGTASAAADVYVGADLNSAYVYHGITYNDGAVFQPWANISKNGFGFNVWANLDIGDYGNTLDGGEFSEVDLTLSYVRTSMGLDWTLSYAEYLFPNLDNSEGTGAYEGTKEIILEVSRNLWSGLSAKGKVQYDIDEVKDIYARLTLTYKQQLSDDVSMSLDADGAYAGEDVSITEKSGLHDYNIVLKLDRVLTDSVTAGASIGYSGSLDKDVLPKQDVDVFGGVSIAAAL